MDGDWAERELKAPLLSARSTAPSPTHAYFHESGMLSSFSLIKGAVYGQCDERKDWGQGEEEGAQRVRDVGEDEATAAGGAAGSVLQHCVGWGMEVPACVSTCLREEPQAPRAGSWA